MKKILIVDDMQNTRFVLSEAFKIEGYEVIEARDGIEAVNYASEKLPDLIIMDIDMPQKNGFEAITEIRSDPNTRAIPILVNTGKEDILLKIGKECGEKIQAVIEKPYRIDEIISKVKEMFNDVQ